MLESFSLFRKKKPFFFGETFGNQSFHSPPPGGVGIGGEFGADQGGAGVGLSGEGRWGSDIKGKKPFFSDEAKEAIESLSELEFGEKAYASLGKAGGRGGGKFSIAANPFMSHEMMAPSGRRFDPDEQKKRWWQMQGLLA